jgi:nitroreductase
MDVKEAIEYRRAYRSLEPVEITNELVLDLAKNAGLAPSCYNKQPWRFVFVYDTKVLKKLSAAMSKGNNWTQQASMIIAVFSQKDLDCIVKDREYYLFDTGIAAGFLILRATELGLVVHPIAGYDEEMVKEILGIPEHMRVITLIIAGKKSDQVSPLLSEKMVEAEKQRPHRLKFENFAFIDSYKESGR